MAVYWVTEAIPIAVTALLPVVLMPWLGVLGSKDLCMHYLKVIINRGLTTVRSSWHMIIKDGSVVLDIKGPGT